MPPQSVSNYQSRLAEIGFKLPKIQEGDLLSKDLLALTDELTKETEYLVFVEWEYCLSPDQKCSKRMDELLKEQREKNLKLEKHLKEREADEKKLFLLAVKKFEEMKQFLAEIQDKQFLRENLEKVREFNRDFFKCVVLSFLIILEKLIKFERNP